MGVSCYVHATGFKMDELNCWLPFYAIFHAMLRSTIDCCIRPDP